MISRDCEEIQWYSLEHDVGGIIKLIHFDNKEVKRSDYYGKGIYKHYSIDRRYSAGRIKELWSRKQIRSENPG